MEVNQARLQGSDIDGKEASVEISYRRQPWYEAYMAALFEANRKQILVRIRHAEQQILARERELLTHGNELSEQHALNNALHALHALSSCMQV